MPAPAGADCNTAYPTEPVSGSNHRFTPNCSKRGHPHEETEARHAGTGLPTWLSVRPAGPSGIRLPTRQRRITPTVADRLARGATRRLGRLRRPIRHAEDGDALSSPSQILFHTTATTQCVVATEKPATGGFFFPRPRGIDQPEQRLAQSEQRLLQPEQRLAQPEKAAPTYRLVTHFHGQ